MENGNCTVKHSDYKSKNIHTWCTGCGNYGIYGALRNALVEECIAPKDVMLVYDIGCNGNGADKINGYRCKSLHGRALPFATGAAIANRRMKVIAMAGDGAVLSEGINHLIHAIRSNYNITLVVHNNSNFALTTGQPSPSTKENLSMNSSPDGVTSDPLNLLKLALPLDPSFVARGFSGNIKQLTSILREAMKHDGFSLVEVIQTCTTYNKATPHEWMMERVYDVNEKTDYDNSNLNMAMEVVGDLDIKIATGVLYRNNWKQSYYMKQPNRVDAITELVDEVVNIDTAHLVESFK
jgi:2-oxoglutarate ferredoxin oxidoreductase subunit beta